MSSSDRTLESLLELGNPTVRRTRAEHLEHAMRVALMLMDADAVVALTPANRRGKRLALHAGSTAAAVLPAPTQGSEVARSLTECCQPILFPDLSADARAAAGDNCPGVEAGPAMFVPLRQRDPVAGYLAVYKGCGRAPFTTSDSRLILLLSAWLSTTLDGLRLLSGLERLAVTDDLTEVYNSRFLVAALRREIRRASRFNQELSIVRVDVDNLKAYNAERGDLHGSLLLKEVASLLAQQIRSFDLMARYDDDEFMLILPQTGRDGAMVAAERMRSAVERHAFPPTDAGAVTVSLGVASFPLDGADSAALIAASDRALRQAKQRGMNCAETLVTPEARKDNGTQSMAKVAARSQSR